MRFVAVELLILGVGPMLKPLSPAFMEHFKKLGVAVEVMNTVSALSIVFERHIDILVWHRIRSVHLKNCGNAIYTII